MSIILSRMTSKRRDQKKVKLLYTGRGWKKRCVRNKDSRNMNKRKARERERHVCKDVYVWERGNKLRIWVLWQLLKYENERCLRRIFKLLMVCDALFNKNSFVLPCFWSWDGKRGICLLKSDTGTLRIIWLSFLKNLNGFLEYSTLQRRLLQNS